MKPSALVIAASLLIAGVIHLLPVTGALGAGPLASLYGLDFSEPNLAILMRHRAVLFGLLGVFLVVAAFRPAMQLAALLAGLASVVSFLLIAWSTGDYSPAISRIVAADLVALAALGMGSIAWFRRRRSQTPA